mgnify:CR=1 FL=1
MIHKQRTVALIVAAGSGSRAGGAIPKQYAHVGGKALLAHAYAAFAGHPAVDEVVVVIAAGAEPLAAAALGPVRTIVGGATRRESVARGLAAIETDRVLVHDAARPFVPAKVIDRILAALDTNEGAIPGLAVADTLVRDGSVVSRDGLFRVQTPQGFRLPALRAAHDGWPADEEATDDAQMVQRLGGSVALVQGDAMLDKVTHPEDFAAAEAKIAWETRSASGFDVHRLEAGEDLWLGGVLIPHDKGLSGHSDADVGLHALTDALLGTIAVPAQAQVAVRQDKTIRVSYQPSDLLTTEGRARLQRRAPGPIIALGLDLGRLAAGRIAAEHRHRIGRPVRCHVHVALQGADRGRLGVTFALQIHQEIGLRLHLVVERLVEAGLLLLLSSVMTNSARTRSSSLAREAAVAFFSSNAAWRSFS